MFRLDPLRRILISASPSLIVISGCVGMTQTSMMLPQVDDPVRLSPNLQPLRDPSNDLNSEESGTRIYGYSPRPADGPEQIIPSRKPKVRTLPDEPEVPEDSAIGELPAQEPRTRKSLVGPLLGPPELATSEPMELTVEVDERAQIGNGATFQLVVQNPNPHDLTNVVVEATFDDALIFPGHEEKTIRRTLGTLAAGKSHKFAVMLSSETAGKHCTRFSIKADNVSSTQEEVCIEYIANELEISILGPNQRTVGTRAEFTIKLQNHAKHELTGVSLAITHDPALEPREGSVGAKFEKQKMSWELDNLQSGEILQVQVEFACLSAVENTCVIVDVTNNELPSLRKAECLEIVERQGPLEVELIDTRDPVTVEEATEHLLTVRNRSDETVDAIGIVARIPVQLDTISAYAEMDGQKVDVEADVDIDRVVFSRIGALAAGSTLTIHIESKTLKTGDGELSARVLYGEGDNVIDVSEPLTVNAKPLAN